MYQTDLPTRAELPSTRQLLISTALAVAIATLLTVTVVLPAEFAIDPTGLGSVLGLTRMGEIKRALAQEADADAAAKTQTAPQLPMRHITLNSPAPGQRADEVVVTLKPNEGAEVKLEMSKDARVDYEWTVTGGVVNFDTHADNAEIDYHSYGAGENVDTDTGELVAAFDGRHGWFWRNRGKGDVSVTLKTKGSYTSVERVM